MSTPPRIPCEFFLIRYVPDVVKGEFTNIGVLLREVRDPEAKKPSSLSPPRLRFTRDWSRVECLHPDADTAMLEALEAEMLDRLQNEPADPATYPKPILIALADSLSNSIQLSEPRASLAENLTLELDQLMKLYVEPLRVIQGRRRSSRAIILSAMRKEFERAGVWHLMRKRVTASSYTRPGDPMKLDCGYRPNGDIRFFHAVSLEHGVEAAKSLSFSASQLREGIRRVESASLDLAAIVEPLRSLKSPPATKNTDQESEDDFTVEDDEVYQFGVSTMESAGIRVLTTNNLAAAAERARLELGL